MAKGETQVVDRNLEVLPQHPLAGHVLPGDDAYVLQQLWVLLEQLFIVSVVVERAVHDDGSVQAAMGRVIWVRTIVQPTGAVKRDFFRRDAGHRCWGLMSSNRKKNLVVAHRFGCADGEISPSYSDWEWERLE